MTFKKLHPGLWTALLLILVTACQAKIPDHATATATATAATTLAPTGDGVFILTPIVTGYPIPENGNTNSPTAYPNPPEVGVEVPTAYPQPDTALPTVIIGRATQPQAPRPSPSSTPTVPRPPTATASVPAATQTPDASPTLSPTEPPTETATPEGAYPPPGVPTTFAPYPLPEGQPTQTAYPGPEAALPPPTPIPTATPRASQQAEPTRAGSGAPATQAPGGTPGPTPTATPLVVHSGLAASDPHSFQMASGKYQMVEFFAFWSPASKSMAPLMNNLQARYKERIHFVYLDIDDPANSLYKTLLAERLPPLFYLLDGQGNVIQEWRGYVAIEAFEQAYLSIP